MHLFFTWLHSLCTLSTSPLKHALRTYFDVVFTYLISTSFPVAFLFFQMRKTNRFFAYAFIMESNLRYMTTLTCKERLTELQRSCQQIVASSFLFSVTHLGGFSIDQMKFICWVWGIRALSLQSFYNISNVEPIAATLI